MNAGVTECASTSIRQTRDLFEIPEGIAYLALVPGASYGIAVAAANLPVSSNQTIVLLDHKRSS